MNRLISLIKISMLLLLSYFIFKDIEFDKLILILNNYSVVGIVLIMSIILVGDYFYALRWYYLSDKKCSILASFESTILSTLLNLILPAKLGEISRVIYLKKLYNYYINNSVSLLIIEKFFDLLFLAIFSFISAVYILENNMVTNAAYLLVLICIILITALKSKYTLFILKKIPFKLFRVYSIKIYKFIYNSFNINKLLIIILISMTTWFIYYLTSYILFIYIAEFDLTIFQTFIVFVISVIAFSLPITPGAVGIYEGSIIMSLGWYGIDKESALMAAIALRFFHLFLMLLLSILILWNKKISFKKLSGFVNAS